MTNAIDSPKSGIGAGGWKPIETAPMDGYMLVHEDGAIRALFRYKGAWQKIGYPAIVSDVYPDDAIVGSDAKRMLPTGFRLEVRDGCCENPTHWMELPDLPGASTGARDVAEAAGLDLPEALQAYVDYDIFINGPDGDPDTDRLQKARRALATPEAGPLLEQAPQPGGPGQDERKGNGWLPGPGPDGGVGGGT